MTPWTPEALSNPVFSVTGRASISARGQHHRPGLVGRHSDNSGAADLVDLIAQGTERRRDPRRGPMLLQSQFGLPVEMLVGLGLPGQLHHYRSGDFLCNAHWLSCQLPKQRPAQGPS